MAKRVESFQADCLDGGSTPPSSTKKREKMIVFSLFLWSCPITAPIFTFLPKSLLWQRRDLVKDEHIFDNSNCWSFSLVEHTLNLNTHYYAFSTNSINKNRLLFRGGNVGGSSPEEQKIRIALAFK